MAVTPDLPSVTFAKAPLRSAIKHFYLLKADTDGSLLPQVVNAGFSALDLPHQLSVFQVDSGELIEEMARQPGIAGGIIDLELSGHLVGEAEYVNEVVEEIGCANVVTKDEFSDLHVDNTYHTALTQLILQHMANTQVVGGLVLGSTAIGRTAAHALEQLGIAVNIWDLSGDGSGDLSGVDFSNVSIVISGLASTSNFPSMPDLALRADTLVIETIVSGGIDTPLEAQAKVAKCALVAGVELELEAVLLAFQALVSPIGLPRLVSVPEKAMAQALLAAVGERCGEEVSNSVAEEWVQLKRKL